MKFLYSRLDKRALGLALFVGLTISLLQFVCLLRPIPLEDTPYTRWLAVDPFSFTPIIFFILLPLIASLPAGIMLKEDVDSGLFAKFKLTNSLRQILLKYAGMTFLTGFMVSVLPLLVNLGGWFMILPNIKPDNLLNSNILAINLNMMLVSLYYAHPFVHALISIIFTGLWGGLFALFVMVTSIWINNRFIALCSSLFLQIIVLVLNKFIKLPHFVSYSPADFLHELAPDANVSLLVTGIVTLIMLAYCMIGLLVTKKKIVQ